MGDSHHPNIVFYRQLKSLVQTVHLRTLDAGWWVHIAITGGTHDEYLILLRSPYLTACEKTAVDKLACQEYTEFLLRTRGFTFTPVGLGYLVCGE